MPVLNFGMCSRPSRRPTNCGTRNEFLCLFDLKRGNPYLRTIPKEQFSTTILDNRFFGRLVGEYYAGPNENRWLYRLDPGINFNWVTGDNGPGGVDFSPEVYVGRIPVYDNDVGQLDAILR
jgi:hypothetical protein